MSRLYAFTCTLCLGHLSWKNFICSVGKCQFRVFFLCLTLIWPKAKERNIWTKNCHRVLNLQPNWTLYIGNWSRVIFTVIILLLKTLIMISKKWGKNIRTIKDTEPSKPWTGQQHQGSAQEWLLFHNLRNSGLACKHANYTGSCWFELHLQDPPYLFSIYPTPLKVHHRPQKLQPKKSGWGPDNNSPRDI